MNSRKMFSPYLFASFFLLLPLFNFAQKQASVDIALSYLQEHQQALQLTSKDLMDFQVSDIYTSQHNGVTHVYLNQTHQNIKVVGALINVNIFPNGEVLNVGNRFIPNLQQKINSTNPTISPEYALREVLKHFKIAPEISSLELQTKIDEQHYIFDPSGIALEPVKVNLAYQATTDKSVRLVWRVELYQLDAQHWWNVRIDANTGTILQYDDQVIHCDFDHGGSSCTDHNHKHANIEHSSKTTTKTAAVNSYNVFPMPVQSPNHGSSGLVSSPVNDAASPFGWHDTDGINGPEFTITRGNNVHAYQDIFDNNASLGDEPDGGSDLDFNFPIDLSNGSPYTQVDPAVTNLFYWNNVIHDVWYQYGFDEISGNFQVNNYENPGQDGDWIRAEALDGSGINNANFGTGGDGSTARMQMYIWTNENLPDPPPAPELIITNPMEAVGNYEMASAAFGGILPNPAIVADIVLVDDGVGTTSNACEEILNTTELEGAIALIDRGVCQFGTKALNAEAAGAIAVIVCNNSADPIFQMAAGDFGAGVTIPAVMISQQDCNTLKTTLAGLAGELGQEDVEIPMPGPSGFDGDFDNGIIVHEYGHGISIRLTGGPSVGDCLFNEEQAGEGWSDWFALVMSTDASNNADERRGIGTYAIGQPINGGGIRPFPYSRDMSIDPHTYGDLPNAAIPHGVGSIWCVMIWDLYWDLIDVYGYDNDIYNGTGGNNIAMQLVIDGLKLQECNPSFIDSRNAILAADEANYNGANQCLIWKTFARRGLGVGASAGGNESFEEPTFCTPIKIVKTASTEVKAGETITYTLEISNNLPSLVSNVVIEDIFPEGTSLVEGSLSCDGGTVDNDILTIDLGNLAPNTSLVCTYDLLVDNSSFSYIELADDVEAGTANWAISSGAGNVNWQTSFNSYEGDLAWFAQNIESQSDQYLSLANPINLEGDHPSLVFWHAYDTETDWDGGVVEVSTDNGANWIDQGNNMTKNGYVGNLEVNPASPISGRAAFHGNSGGYIQTIIDLSDYSNQNILVRFRFGTDGAVGGNGWFIDNIEFYGDFRAITNSVCAKALGVEDDCAEVTTVVFENDLNAVDELEEAIKVTIAPNPTTGVFVLQMNSAFNSNSIIDVLSIDGRRLQRFEFDRSNGAFEFDLSAYQAGIYLLQIQTGQTSIVRKVIVE